MQVEYAAYSPEEEDIVHLGSYAEAVQHGGDTWLMVDGWPVIKKLPSSFDRLVILADGTEIKSSVLNRREVQSAWGPEWLGDEALMLTIDQRDEVVTTYDARFDVERSLWPHDE